MTYQTPATLTDEERDYLVSALKERGITPEKWNESRQLLAEFFEFVNDNRDYLKRLGDYVTREAEKDPRQGAASLEADYVEDILNRAIEAMESPDTSLPSVSYLMNGNPLQTLTRVLTSGGNPEDSSVTREKWEIITEEDDETGITGRRAITFKRKTRGEVHSITITDPELFAPGNTRDRNKRGTIIMRKFLPYTLQKMIQQGYPEAVRIELPEVVRLMKYKSEETAYRAVVKFVQQMETVDLSQTKKGRGKNAKTTSSGGILFIHRTRRGSIVNIYVNPHFDIHVLAEQFTVFPDWAYALGTGAFDLVRYIFYIARQNTKAIAETGTFNISIEAVRIAMGLPDVEEVKNRRYKQLIRTPIEEAIVEVEQRVAETPEAKGRFFITPRVNDATDDIDTWIKTGSLEIELRDEYVTLFTKIAEDQKTLIEGAKKAEQRKKASARKGK